MKTCRKRQQQQQQQKHIIKIYCKRAEQKHHNSNKFNEREKNGKFSFLFENENYI